MKEIKKGIYKHYKGGLFAVIGQTYHPRTAEDLVIFVPIHPEPVLNSEPDVLPAEKFCEIICRPNFNYEGPRFAFVKSINEAVMIVGNKPQWIFDCEEREDERVLREGACLGSLQPQMG